MRDRSIDTARGLLVLVMIYGHVLQFFGLAEIYPSVTVVDDIINAIVFPGFVFFFGRTVALAYLNKTWKQALPGMLRTAARAYLAFAVSGIGYLVLYEKKKLAADVVTGVLTVTSVPGWSEFLIAFALYMVVVIALFPLLKRMQAYPWAAAPVSLACAACTFLPYEGITLPQLAVWIGGVGQSYFPVVQYAPYFLAGLVYTSLSEKGRVTAVLLAAGSSAAALISVAVNGWSLPGRFPPTWSWILLPAVVIAGLQALCTCLCGKENRVIHVMTNVLGSAGAASLYYLLASNLTLFTLASKNRAPELDAKLLWPWNQGIYDPVGAVTWTAILILLLAFVRRLAGRGTAGKK